MLNVIAFNLFNLAYIYFLLMALSNISAKLLPVSHFSFVFPLGVPVNFKHSIYLTDENDVASLKPVGLSLTTEDLV